MEEYDLGRGSRASSPGDDYIDVEGNVGLVPPNSIHRTMGADTSVSHTTPPARKQAPVPASTEVKRGRGRPRKQRDPVEEGMLYIQAQSQLIIIELIHHSLVRNWSCIVLHHTHIQQISIHKYYTSMYVHSPLGLVYSVYPLVMLLLLLFPFPPHQIHSTS